MNAEAMKRRRMRLLKRLAARARYRHDTKVPLREFAESSCIQGPVVGTGLTSEIKVLGESANDLTYDLDALRIEGLIERTYLDYDQDVTGGMIGKNPGVTLTLKGLEAVAAANKSWLRKSIEQQPITFLQVMVTIVLAVLTFLVGLAAGRYVTPPSNGAASPAMGHGSGKTPLGTRQ